MKCLGLILVILIEFSANAQSQGPYYYNPDWSPDRSKVVFESNKDGKFSIYTLQADGSGLQQLTSGAANDEQARWSPDGRRIVFISDRDGHLQLYIMNADGSEQRRVTKADDIDYQPDFAPNGDYVAFQSRPERASVIHDIYLIRGDGSGRTRLTDQRADYSGPRWSPDGGKLLFERSPIIKKYYRDLSPEERTQMKASKEIFVMNKDGANLRNLTNNNVRDCCAQWSKDGKTIYFLSERDGAPHIYVMKADGSKVRRVADGSIVSVPSVSRDGKYLAYSKEVQGKWGLYIYDIKSRKERLLIGG